MEDTLSANELRRMSEVLGGVDIAVREGEREDTQVKVVCDVVFANGNAVRIEAQAAMMDSPHGVAKWVADFVGALVEDERVIQVQ